MSTIKIYGCYAEGFILKGSAELKAVEPCSSVYDIKEAYASLNIDIIGSIPVVMNLDNGVGLAPGFIVGDVTYLHFASGNVPDEILVREA